MREVNVFKKEQALIWLQVIYHKGFWAIFELAFVGEKDNQGEKNWGHTQNRDLETS